MTKEGNFSGEETKGCFVKAEDLKETMEYVSGYSMYAFEDEIRQGFITIQGGHRIGLGGRTVVQNQEIRLMKFISFLNVRIAHQIIGCADDLMGFLYQKEAGESRFLNTLLISPPRMGKTTMLRDIIRHISWGGPGIPGMTVGVVDERSELGACYQGIPQNDLGPRTDILDCCPKVQGMMMLVRSMSPQVVAVDEIGGSEDAKALDYVRNCGCAIAATAHGTSFKDVKEKKDLARVFQALRIEVNGELGALASLLRQSTEVLRPGGRLAVITYHSLEDRLVKNFIRSGNVEGRVEKDFYGNVLAPLRAVNNRVVVPSDEEVERNPRARSAKLRVAVRVADGNNG